VRLRLLLIACALLVLAAASSAAAGPVRATMSTSSTKPLAGTPWRYTVVVKELAAGSLLAGRMRLQVLDGTTVVGCWKRGRIRACSGANAGTWISFKGRRTGVIAWQARYATLRLTFQAIVVAGTPPLLLRAPVTVQLP
jgi:hypothetical protein